MGGMSPRENSGGLSGGFSSGQPPQYGTSPPPPQYGMSPPPPQYGMSPPPPQYGMGVAPIVVQAPSFGKDPVSTVCMSCHANITTSTNSETGTIALLTAGLLCFFGCWCCAWVPFCMDSMKDVGHRCPQCNRIVGRYKARF